MERDKKESNILNFLNILKYKESKTVKEQTKKYQAKRRKYKYEKEKKKLKPRKKQKVK